MTIASMDLQDIDSMFVGPDTGARMSSISPEQYAAARNYWGKLTSCQHLSPRMRELVLLAVHASACTLNDRAIGQYVKRALAAGATEADIVDTLLAVVGLANHGVMLALPILVKVLQEQAPAEPPLTPEMRPDAAQARDEYYAARRFGPFEKLDLVGTWLPDYAVGLLNRSTQTWTHGSLTRKERHLLCISIDASVAHAYESGIEAHMRFAIQNGATREEILEVLQLTGLMGIEGFLTGADSLCEGNETSATSG